MSYTYILLIVLALILGGLIGYFARQIIANQQVRNARKEAKKLLDFSCIRSSFLPTVSAAAPDYTL